MSARLISVVIPVHNRADLIAPALDSVFIQTYRPLELIVVDDGSSDGTSDVVRDWINAHADADQFSARLIAQEKAGGNAARNRGIAESKGEFIAFLDSDDRWLAEKLQKQIVKFDDPAAGGVYCGVQHIDLATGSVLESSSRDYPSGWLLDQLLVRDVTAQTSAFIVRRSVFDQVGVFDVNLPARQDWDMWIRLASAYKIDAVPEALVQYGEHSGSRTATDPMREIRAYDAIRKKYDSLLNQQPRHVQRAAKASYYKRMGRVYFHHRNSTLKAIQFYGMSIFYQPMDFDSYAALAGMLMPRSLRQSLHVYWNRLFGGTRFAIRSH